jgi:hypothetical protein
MALWLTFELSEFVQEFMTEVEGLTLRLVFKLYIILPNEDMVQQGSACPQGSGYLSNWAESMYYQVQTKVKIFC